MTVLKALKNLMILLGLHSDSVKVTDAPCTQPDEVDGVVIFR